MRFLKREEISDGTVGTLKIILFKPFLIREEICNTKAGKI
jgi:hypothetical protein